jgi:hypothetical protein
LDEKLALTEGDAEPIIRDGIAYDPQVFCKTIRFLASGYLTPLEEQDRESSKTWDSLVELYNFGRALSIESLQVTMLAQFCYLINAFDPAVFLALARRYYDRNHDSTRNTSLRHLIKIKLAGVLPRLQQTMTIKDISSQSGILGMQLIEVLLEDRANNQDAPLKDPEVVAATTTRRSGRAPKPRNTKADD